MMFDWLAALVPASARTASWGRYLWAPHNFHHLVWTLTVLDLDIPGRCSGSGYLFYWPWGSFAWPRRRPCWRARQPRRAGSGLRLVGAAGAVAIQPDGMRYPRRQRRHQHNLCPRPDLRGGRHPAGRGLGGTGETARCASGRCSARRRRVWGARWGWRSGRRCCSRRRRAGRAAHLDSYGVGERHDLQSAVSAGTRLPRRNAVAGWVAALATARSRPPPAVPQLPGPALGAGVPPGGFADGLGGSSRGSGCGFAPGAGAARHGRSGRPSR